MKPGIYPATLKDFHIRLTQTNKKQFVAAFEVSADGENKSLYYTTNFDPESKYFDKLMETLSLLGCDSVEKYCRLGEGSKGGALALGTAVSVTVEEREYEGKTYLNAKYVNRPAGAKFADLKPEDTATITGSLKSSAAAAASFFTKKNIKATPMKSADQKPEGVGF